MKQSSSITDARLRRQQAMIEMIGMPFISNRSQPVTTTAMRAVLQYAVIVAFSLIAGLIAMMVCKLMIEHTSERTKTDWPRAELHIAAAAAVAFEKDHGRLPLSLDELRSQGADIYLPRNFDLPGILYFRAGTDEPRLSWRDDVDSAAAYCCIDAALHERC